MNRTESVFAEGNWIKPETIRATNRTGATVAPGDLAAFDLTGADTDVMTLTEYEAATPAARSGKHPLRNLVAIASGNVKGWIYAVAAETIADNAEGLWYITGLVPIKVVGSSAVANGAILSPTSGQVYASVAANGTGVIGVAGADGPSGGTPALALVFFDGFALSGPLPRVS